MNWDAWLPLLVVASSLLPGLVIFFLREGSHRLRTALNLAGASPQAGAGRHPDLGRVSRTCLRDAAGPWRPASTWYCMPTRCRCCSSRLSTVLWLVTTVYAIGYLENSPHRSRFFGFFSLCVSATVGLALAGNLFTFVIFYELLTLATYPLVAHRGTPEAVRGARIYLAYTLGGGMLLLIGTVWLHVIAGPTAFVEGGILGSLPTEYHPQLKMIFLLLIIGLGVKAALVPLHGWLPQAMVAPAPVSALLHAVAVVKAGAFGIVRVVYDVYGVNFADQLGLLTGLGIAAAITIVYGSVKALFQDNLKKRLAYSTVSQVSYIALGIAILGPVGTIGGIVHLVHQGIMKITLFFAAGNYAETLGIHKISEMNGVGRRMPAHDTGLQCRRTGHDRRAAGGGVCQQVVPGPGRPGGRYGDLGHAGADYQQRAQRGVFSARAVPCLVPRTRPCLAGRAHTGCTPRNQRGAAVAAGGDRDAGPGGRPVRRRPVQPAGVGDTDRAPGVWPVNTFILLLIWVLPLALAVLAGQRYASWIAVIAPLPALLAAAVVPVGTSVSLPWLLLGVELGLDDTGRVFLLFSGLLWLVASLYAAGSLAGDHKATRFRIFFLLAMAGNLGLIVAQDAVSFYLGFTLMGLAAYGLVAQSRSQHARQAARRYLVWTIAGEMLLFIAVVMLAAQHNGVVTFSVLQSSPPAGFVVLLLLIGFGIKLALPGLHLWLPQAYAVTPTPAVAVLSGSMINAGLLGWLRFLPPGDAALVGWGQVLLAAGITGIFFGAIAGLLQRSPRLLLGYSSISKMGVLTSGMGAALAWPETAPVVIAAVVIYAAHHALVKGALFLGLGLVEREGLRPWIQVGLVFLALALAGAPLTSGAFAKSVLTSSLPGGRSSLILLLAASAFVTTLLMVRFLFLVRRLRVSKPRPSRRNRQPHG